MRMRILLLCCAALALTVGVSTATGDEGNSAAAKACQKGGWQSVITSDEQLFANQGACVAYVVKGGVLAAPFLTILNVNGGADRWAFNAFGAGLKPGTIVEFIGEPGDVDIGGGSAHDDGTALTGVSGPCSNFEGITSMHAVGTRADGQPITSNTVSNPCPA